MTERPRDAKFLTPFVMVSAGLVLVTGLALAIVSFSQAWKALLAIGFVVGAGAIIVLNNKDRPNDDLNTRTLKRTRAVYIVASVLLASELIFATARASGWFGEDPERWTIQWLLVALTAATIEMLGLTGDKKDKSDKGE